MSDTELTIDLETTTEFRSLSGKELPLGWPRIVPDEEFKHKLQEFDSQKDLAINKFSYELVNGDKRLLYLAVHHTSNPEHPQLDVLEQRFKEFKPQVVLYEGEARPLQGTGRDCISRDGEPGFVRFLVKEHNDRLKAGETPVIVDSGDQPFGAWVHDFRKHGFTNEDIAVFVVLRRAYLERTLALEAKVKELGRELTDKERDECLQDLERKFRVYLRNQLSSPSSYVSRQLSYLPRSDGENWTLELIAEGVQKLVGKEPKFSRIALHQDLQDSFYLESQFRDAYIIRKIAKILQEHNRVMIVMGVSHPLREEAALRQFFE